MRFALHAVPWGPVGPPWCSWSCFDETANNLIRIGFFTVTNTSLYEIHYAGANFTSLAERDANLLANGFAGVADAWVRVTDEPGVPATDNFRAA